uniref:Uncharacterized protein n=1 Tax=Kalanchoe fedtschenkoi TaxID=63787 RepID=A0A7N0TUD1_KALFE
MFFSVANLTHKHKPQPDLMAYDLFSSPSLYPAANTKHHQIWWMTSLFLLPHQIEPQAPTKIRSGANNVTFASLPSVGSFFGEKVEAWKCIGGDMVIDEPNKYEGLPTTTGSGG